MSKTKNLIDKKIKKYMDKKCYFCSCDNYSQLQVHRIIFGCDGGEYSDHNTLTVCANCHCAIHANQIKIDRKYYSSNGSYILHYWLDDKEIWK